MPAHTYIFVPSRDMWPAASINARIPPIKLLELNKDGTEKTISPAAWLDKTNPSIK
jgi:hypothetical protein